MAVGSGRERRQRTDQPAPGPKSVSSLLPLRIAETRSSLRLCGAQARARDEEPPSSSGKRVRSSGRAIRKPVTWNRYLDAE